MSAPSTLELPPTLALYQLAVGHYVSRALFVAAKLELADHLGSEPESAEELAARVDCDPRSLRRMLRLLAASGVFAEHEDGRFGHTPSSEALRAKAAGTMRSAVMLFAGVGIQDGWKELEFCVRTGEPAFRKNAPDSGPFDQPHWEPGEEEVFDAAMANFTAQTAGLVAHAYDFADFEMVADVGGGNGALLIGLLTANAELRGVVFDRPAVAERAKAAIDEAGFSNRIEAQGGDFFESGIDNADAYLMKHVIHDWDDTQAANILRTCRAHMPSHARLLLLEDLYPDRIDTSLPALGAAQNDVNMLVSTGGRQRTQGEFEALLAASGFKLTRVVPTLGPIAVIEAVPS